MSRCVPQFFARLNDVVPPMTAFRMGVTWSHRNRWMQVARESRREGDLSLMRLAVREARTKNRDLITDLRLARIVKRHTRAAA